MTSLLLPILSPSQCASCKFCCSFAAFEAWEAPLFSEEHIVSLTKKYGQFPVKKVGTSYTLDFSEYYLSHQEEAEPYAPCPFLSKQGCILSDEEKPFDCKIWPLRIMRITKGQTVLQKDELPQNSSTSEKQSASLKNDTRLVLALTPTCIEINKVPLEDVRYFVNTSRIMQAIADEATQLPEMIKTYREGFPLLAEY